MSMIFIFFIYKNVKTNVSDRNLIQSCSTCEMSIKLSSWRKVFTKNSPQGGHCITNEKKSLTGQICLKRKNSPTIEANSIIELLWWGEVDSNHRSHGRQIYSLFPLAAREPHHAIQKAFCFLPQPEEGAWPSPATRTNGPGNLELVFIALRNMELTMGIEPATCWLQISCSASWATPASRHGELIEVSIF